MAPLQVAGPGTFMFALFADLLVSTIAFAMLMVVVSIGGSVAAFTLIW